MCSELVNAVTATKEIVVISHVTAAGVQGVLILVNVKMVVYVIMWMAVVPVSPDMLGHIAVIVSDLHNVADSFLSRYECTICCYS